MSASRIVLLVLALALPLAVGIGAWRFLLRRRGVARALGGGPHATRLAGEDLDRAPVLRLALVLGAALALGVALADPRWGAAEGETTTTGGPVVVVVDVSSSMLARDVSPDRLTRAKASLRALIAGLGGRPIGIVAFAGQAVTLTPPTVDPGAVELYLASLDPEMVTQSGSGVVAAVRQALGVLVSSEAEGGTVVLFTDGDGVEDADAAAEISRMAGRAGLAIFTVGVGTATGAQVPDIDFATGREIGVKRDPSGAPAVSRLREDLLRSIARESGGDYLALAESGAQARLAAAVAAARTAGASRSGTGSGQSRFAGFAAIALMLLFLEGASRILTSRRHAAALLLAALLAAPSCARDVEVASDRAAAERRLAQLRDAAGLSPRSDRARYNLGTGLVLAARYPEARPHLRVAAASSDRAMRQRAEYNAGSSHLEPAFEPAPDPRRRESLRAAVEAYKRALLLDPGDADAKWNLELARRLLREQPPSPEPEPNPDAGGGGGGGGEGGGGADPQAGRQDPRPQPGSGGGDSPELSPEAAEELLSAAEERELSVQMERMKKPQPRNPSAH